MSLTPSLALAKYDVARHSGVEFVKGDTPQARAQSQRQGAIVPGSDVVGTNVFDWGGAQ